MSDDDDDKLRDEFARLRRVDARRTPSVETLSRAPTRGPLRPAFFAVIPLVAAAAALLFVCNGAPQSEPVQASVSPSTPPADLLPGAGALAASTDNEPLPLDFLLQTRVASTDLGGSDFLLRGPKDLRGQLP